MAYTNDVPQPQQQIATTQPIINNNFGFIQAAIDIEHNFVPNATDPTVTYHKQASMPTLADPIGLPAGTDGLYYVNTSNIYSVGVPKFVNSAGPNFIPVSSCVNISISNNSISLNNTPTMIGPAIPANSCGTIFIYGQTSVGQQHIWTAYTTSATTISLINTNVSSNIAISTLGLTILCNLVPIGATSSSIRFVFQISSP